jgi:membrane protease YdiL (CAAX protease family)
MSEDGEQKGVERSIVLLAIAVEGGLIGVAWLVGFLVGQPPLELFFWNFREALLGLAATVPMLILFFACLRWPIGPLKPVREFCDRVLRPLMAPCTILDLAGISLLAGLGEEMLFRGVFQAGFAHWLDEPWTALALASVLFGLCHAITPAYTVLATLLGAYLGWLYMHTGNLVPSILAHAVYDFIALIILVRRPVTSEPGA